jgi:DegV family protein with EDD domain
MTVMSHERVVLTDTASSLSQVEADKFGVELIPFHIIWPDQKFTDFTISSNDIYQRIKTNGIPSTSGPNTNDFSEIYEKIYSTGAKEVFSIHLGLTSVTLNSAQAVANEMSDIHPNFKVHVINSRALTVAQEFQTLRAKELIDQGKDTNTILQELNSLRENTVLFGSTGPEVISYLAQSGRLSGLQLFLASKLHLIPIVSLNQEGSISSISKSRHEKKARESVVELFKREVDKRGIPSNIGIVYTQDIEVGQELQYGIRDLLTLPSVRFTGPKEAGSVLAIHVGPRTSVVTACW